MNPEINFQVTATVRWNALEHTILSYMYHNDRHGYEPEDKYTRSQLLKINGNIANVLNPNDDEWTVPERLLVERDPFTNNNEVEELFKKTETLIANLERAELMTETFSYDEEQEL